MAESIDGGKDYEEYTGSNVIEYSKYKTMEFLAEILHEHYYALETFRQVYNDAGDDLENIDHMHSYYNKIFLEDKKSFLIGQLSSQDLQERMSDIQPQLDYFANMYEKISSNFECIIKFFDEPRYVIFHEIKSKRLLERYFDKYTKIEDIFEQYENFAGDNND